jgi:hypothetical protein
MNALLNMPNVIGFACALILIVAAICRADMMNQRRHRTCWFVVYLLIFVHGLVLLGRAIGAIQPPLGLEWHDMPSAVVLVLYLALTRRQWNHGHAPIDTSRGAL